ncbi:MAG: hypothetical protein A2Y14_05105 [Verrucomicrobia bacterium GWF2_51_19]|nr:MAG: hypothetical protein A2Y14_05105 [Verrucomicrobia bacterium GWF2_51_19]
MQPLSNQTLEAIGKLVMQYPQPKSAIVPILHVLQKELWSINLDVLSFVSDMLSLPLLEVESVASFYPDFSRTQVARYDIRVCRSIACGMQESNRVAEILLHKLGCPAFGLPSADNNYSVDFCECLACCDQGPNVKINHAVFHKITPEKANAFVEYIKNEFLYNEPSS